MSDILTQLQDAVDQLANQFVASIYYVHKHHDLQTLSKNDTVRQQQKSEGEDPGDKIVDPFPADVFKDGQKELATDLILKEQQIEYLISILPGLENNEKDQEQMIKHLEEELIIAEEERKAAVKEKEAVLARLDNVLRSLKRP
ncbi:mediator complex, subunit Med21/Med9 [Hyaloscypha hepaticicola]|uniref:Mediator of RNA polymerase II transcription subunit 21 n=1 Tax=Hyaloscypha hepaticicola TaxID=2082293 RepID=A0A2J6QAS6_9HELO|nr:mediator complex, subunit Med21/Med9 [Hyaloscypha hepaticicola]